MERQTRHRILGIIVLVALTIIILPFFQGNKELSPETALIAPPPFPELPATISSTTTESAAIPLAQAEPSTITTEIELPKQKEMKVHQDDSAQSNTDPMKTSKYRIIEEKDITPTRRRNSADLDDSQPGTDVVNPPQDLSMKSNPSSEYLQALKSSVWVVQIGSFKDRANALRMTNQLRANGYRAFIQNITTALEETTRVYVGPEEMRKNALVLADRLQNEMHVKAVIVSYKPLAV